MIGPGARVTDAKGEVTATPTGRAGAFLPPLLLALAWASLDQALKLHTLASVPPYPDRIEVVPGFLAFSYAQNRGAAWSLFDGGVLPLTAVRAAAAVAILGLLWRRPGLPRLQAFAWALVAGGALGNAFDGVARGFVVDTLLSHTLTAVYRPLFGTEYPIFNLADVGVVSGAILLLLSGPLAPGRADGRRRPEGGTREG